MRLASRPTAVAWRSMISMSARIRSALALAFHMSAWVAARSRDYRGSLCSTTPPGTSCA